MTRDKAGPWLARRARRRFPSMSAALGLFVLAPGCYLSHEIEEPVELECGPVPPRTSTPVDSLLFTADDALFELSGVGPARRVATVGDGSLLRGSPDGRFAVVSSARGQTLVEIDAGRSRDLLAGLEESDGCSSRAGVSRVRFRPDGRTLALTCFENVEGLAPVRMSIRTHLLALPSGAPLARGPRCTTGFFGDGCDLYRAQEVCPSDWRMPISARSPAWSAYDPFVDEESAIDALRPDEIPLGRTAAGDLIAFGELAEGRVRLVSETGESRELLSWEGVSYAWASPRFDRIIVVRYEGARLIVTALATSGGREPVSIELECTSALSLFNGDWVSPDGRLAAVPCDSGGTGFQLLNLDNMRLVARVRTAPDVGVVQLGWRADSAQLLFRWGRVDDFRARIVDRAGDEVVRPGLAEATDGRAATLTWRVGDGFFK